MNFVESLGLFHMDAKEIPCITGAGAPTVRTEGAPGALYMDLESGMLYKCLAADLVDGTYTWEPVEGNNTAGEAGGYYIPRVSQVNAVTVRLEWSPSEADMPDIDIVEMTLPAGPQGPAGADGKDYVLTAADKTEIAEQVENATIVQAPRYVETVEEMTDTSRPYVLASTGHIWAYMDTTTEQEVTKTDTITATDENAYQDGYRLDSAGTGYTAQAGYHITPLIDLTKPEYAGKTIQIHLEGAQYASGETYANYIQCRPYATDGATALGNRVYVCEGTSVSNSIYTLCQNISVDYISDISAILTIDMPPLYGFSAPQEIGYIRFCGNGAVADSNIYITYPGTETVTGGQWVDTGTTYAPTLTEEEKQLMVEEVAALVDAQLLDMIGDGTVTV